MSFEKAPEHVWCWYRTPVVDRVGDPLVHVWGEELGGEHYDHPHGPTEYVRVDLYAKVLSREIRAETERDECMARMQELANKVVSQGIEIGELKHELRAAREEIKGKQ